MSRLTDTKREALSLIDAIKTIIENSGQWRELDLDIPSLSVSINPMEFLMEIITRFVSYDEIVEWLANFLVNKIPYIELAAKGVLLASLKDSIDCSVDPRIPEKFRKDFEFPSYNTKRNKGMHINVSAIDSNGILNISPMCQEGSKYYFGTSSYYYLKDENDNIVYDDKGSMRQYFTYLDAVKAVDESTDDKLTIVEENEVNSVYELVRARDFNAFLWFAIHKANFPNATLISTPLNEYADDYGRHVFQEDTYNLKAFSGLVDLTYSKKVKPFIIGNTIIQQSNNVPTSVLSMCISTDEQIKPTTFDDAEDDEIARLIKASCGEQTLLTEQIVNGYAPRTYQMDFVPVSSNFNSLNWYVDRNRYFNFLKKEENQTPRDYSNEFAICNIEYEDEINEGSNLFNMVNNKLLFSIMPKPLIHVPYWGEKSVVPKKILFDSTGKETKDGKYSVRVVSQVPSAIYDEFVTYDILTTVDTVINEGLVVYKDSGEYWLSQSVKPYEVLYECYPGLTIYELNYDLIMGMELFDAKTLTAKLIMSLGNIMRGGNLSLGLEINKSETAYQMRIAQIIKNIIEADAYEVSDCFYTFSNEKYSEMLNEAELKRSQLYPFQDSTNKASHADLADIINELNAVSPLATKEENITAITRAINSATAQITEEVLPEDKYSIKFKIVADMVRMLVTLLVDTLFSPKIMLILEVNRQLMGEDDENITIEDLLRHLMGLITSIVKEIVDIILQALLDWAKSIIADLLEKLSILVVKEQLDYYLRLMRQLITNCMFRFSKRANLATELDKVDYADIDEIERPQTAEC